MKTTARKATRRIATTTQVFAAMVAAGLFDSFEPCDLCPALAAELYERVLLDTGEAVQVCEHCANTQAVGYDNFDA